MKFTILLSIAVAILWMAMPVMAEDVILPHRVIDAATGSVVDFEGLLAQCSEAQVVTLGEQHDDPNTHRVELAVLQGLERRKEGKVVFSMEMFERDVQANVDDYLAGKTTESEFTLHSRPWPNYPTDYKPLIEFAKAHGIHVVAAEVPGPLASLVKQKGYANIQWTDEQKQWISPRYDAPEDAYWEAFNATMQMAGMQGMGGMTPETINLFYQAQVLRDEGMADSIVKASKASPDATVYQINGSFHTMDYLGTFARVKRDLPGAKLISIQVLPVDDLLAPLPEDAPKADYIILVLAPPAKPEGSMPRGTAGAAGPKPQS